MNRDTINAYLEAHNLSWAPSTLKSERARLNAASVALTSPEELWAYAERLAPYSRKTLFIRVVRMEQWAGAGTQFKDWYDRHQRLFKHAYTRRPAPITWQEALKRIERMPPEDRELAKHILSHGLRISELTQVKGGSLRGKGGKVRFTKAGKRQVTPAELRNLRTALKAEGLKPHDLRKLAATRLHEKGFTPRDICEVMGWSSFETAMSYIAPSQRAVAKARGVLSV